MINVTRGIVVYEKTVEANLARELPFMATENLMMAAVRRGADRQEVHELIRRHAQDAAMRVKQEGADNDLLDRLAAEPVFEGVDFSAVLDPKLYVGRAPQQVDAFLVEIVAPIRERYAEALNVGVQLKV
jgi:adenylosuccinate lyase